MEPGHEDREYQARRQRGEEDWRASMEPGHEDREYMITAVYLRDSLMPQWSPVMKTGNTWAMGQVILQNC